MNPLSQQYNQGNGTGMPSVGAVGINIYNPTVGGQANGSYYYPYPLYYPCYPQPQKQPPVNQVAPPKPAPIPPQKPQQAAPQQPPKPQQPVQQQPQQPQQPQANQQEAKKPDQNKKSTPLTDDYIKTLESYLSDPKNAEMRLTGVKELLKRFKEDKSRSKDPALSSLLNKALQDPSQNVRLIALAILNSGYAEGNKDTDNLLKKMQKSKSQYNEDSLTAAKILLNRSGRNLNVESKQSDVPNTPPQQAANQDKTAQKQQEKPQTGQNLNLMSK